MPSSAAKALTIAAIFAAIAVPRPVPASADPSAAGDPRIIDRPIPFGDLRKRLTLEYIRLHYDPAATDIAIVPRMIVIHWTATGTLQDAVDTFAPEVLPSARRDIARGGRVNVSAHFLVDRDGTIYRLMPETLMGRHVIGLNHCAIGVENIGGCDRPLTREQLTANERLVRYLARKHPTVEYLIGHYEYRRFSSHPLWREKDPRYRTVKDDPGAAFMKRLRERVLDIPALKSF